MKLTFDKIVCNNTTYLLHESLETNAIYDGCTIVITCDKLSITEGGFTIEEAKESFAEHFDFIFRRYNELPNDKLSNRVIEIKNELNRIVKEVINN